MCGIAGIFAYRYAATPVDRDRLRITRDHMAACGPDGKGEWFADITLARTRLGWEPEVQLEQGLVQTIAYFQQLLAGE